MRYSIYSQLQISGLYQYMISIISFVKYQTAPKFYFIKKMKKNIFIIYDNYYSLGEGIFLIFCVLFYIIFYPY